MSDEAWKVSPSQYSTWTACQRKWYFEKVLKIASPQHPSAELGERCHTAIENYLKSGQREGDEDVLRILTYVWEQPWLARRVLDPDVHIEDWATGVVGGVPYRGRIDMFWKEGRKAVIVDHKTTANFKYRKTDAEAKTDPQTLFYSEYLFQDQDIDEIEIRYHYIQTRGIPQAPMMVVVSYTRDEILQPLENLGVFLREMRDARELPLEKIPRNEKSCWLYGTRCFYYADCTDAPEASPEESLMDFKKMLEMRKAQQAGETSTAPAPTPAPAPSPAPQPTPAPAPAPSAPPPAPKAPKSPSTGLPLILFGCTVPGADVVELEELATPYIERWQKQNKDVHYLNSDFFKAERAIAVMLASDLASGATPIPPIVYVRNDSPLGRYFSAEMRLLKGKVQVVLPVGL